MNENSLKYTCLFGGGAVRGMTYVGVIKALEELGVQTKTYAGSSVGAVIAALLAVGYGAKEINEIFHEVNFELFRDIQLGIGPKLALSKGELFLDWIRGHIESKVFGDKYKKGSHRAVTFKDLEKNIVVITTDLNNYECKEFSKQETPDFEIAKAIRISCSMPGLIQPLEYNNMILVDGDLQKSWPMWKLSKNLLSDDERILELRLEGFAQSNGLNPLDFANTVYSCMTAMASTFISELYGNRDKFDYLVLNTGNVIVVDFNISKGKRNELVAVGYKQTMDYFKKALPDKKRKILANYKQIYKHMIKIKKQLEHGKIIKAKTSLGEMYTELCELQKIIDLRDYRNINKFKDIFLTNIHYPPLLGKIKLKNEALVLAHLNLTTTGLSDKINELTDYISN